MSLLPIIYTSLLLTGILFLMVLTISYISFKIKNRKAEIKSKTKNETPFIGIQKKSQFVIGNQKNFSTDHGQKIQSKATDVTRAIIERKNGSTKPNITIHKLPNKKPIQKRERWINRRFLTESNDSKLDFLKKSSVVKLKSRIEIMNPGQVQNNFSNIDHSTTNHSIKSKQLSNNNILEHYNDDDSSEFYTLKSAGFSHN